MLKNLDRLKVFYHVYAHQSVGVAAKTLCVSQSAVSQALQKLENEIETPLFTRLHRKMIPTQAGHYLFNTVEPFMLDLVNCLKTIERGNTHPFGELRIGAPIEFGKTYFPAIVAEFRKQYPDVTISLTFGDQNKLFPMLELGQLDFILIDVFQNQRSNFAKLEFLQFTPIMNEEIVLACSNTYFEKVLMGKQSYEWLAQQNFVAYKQNAQSILAWFKYHFARSNLSIQPVFVVDSHEAIVSAIKQHIGMGIVASHLISKELQSNQIVAIQTDKAQIRNQISLAQLQDKIPTLTEKVFLQNFAEKFKVTVAA